ncbi:chloramphenicol acetyltransferase [Pseudoalteromonas sp. JBTF-M23]|uniref:Chloramphenicol acetyltransferase n=1 Tax=Pseudoalteromonas caenipelagi TaxID=2726988 RepID=A0A849VA30_9GAMM|nr:CatA-like O-acetyltransferase [Pseudoalteromonas caenipelagi]NOU49630.1 chloramphenicol acetyltransferase [Pseudoalteromonas caenipelagi]
MKRIDLNTWPRAQHFHFFKSFDKPQFNLTTHLDFSSLYQFAKANQYSFTLCYLYCLLQALNQYAPMRYRIQDGQPCEVDEVTLSTVFLKEDETFRFTPLSVKGSFEQFCAHACSQKAHYLDQSLLNEALELRETHIAQVYVSILPWLNFTSFNHASTDTSHCSGIPKFVFGQYQDSTGLMPLNIEVHHALLDGIHVAQFLTTLKQAIFELVN